MVYLISRFKYYPKQPKKLHIKTSKNFQKGLELSYRKVLKALDLVLKSIERYLITEERMQQSLKKLLNSFKIKNIKLFHKARKEQNFTEKDQ